MPLGDDNDDTPLAMESRAEPAEVPAVDEGIYIWSFRSSLGRTTTTRGNAAAAAGPSPSSSSLSSAWHRPSHSPTATAAPTADRGAAQLRTLRADFKRETYRLNERYMEEYFHDVDFHAHIRKHGPGQTPFDYDHYRTTFKGVDMHHERLKEREERAAKLKEKNLAMKMAAAATTWFMRPALSI